MKSYEIGFADAALADLEEIRSYIGQENSAAASRIAVQIVAACDRLEYLPERGHPGRKRGTREVTVLATYIIVYRIQAKTVVILRVWHGAQDRRN